MFDFTKAKEKFSDIEEYLKKDYLQISTGRANPSLLDSVKIDSYGTIQPLKNVASISTDDARTLRISPWDKGQIKDIEKAVIESRLPFSVSSNDTSVNINIPQLTEEGKKELVKLIKEKLESARVRVRTVRQEILKEIDASDFSDDEKKRYKEEFQKMVDEINKKLEDIYKGKEEDIMSI
jgi:ribosome recycling factor